MLFLFVLLGRVVPVDFTAFDLINSIFVRKLSFGYSLGGSLSVRMKRRWLDLTC